MDNLKINWPLAVAGPASTQHPLWRPWWERLLLALPRPVWPILLAGVVALTLLGAFQKVVAASVQQGELRRQAQAVHVGAIWRCHAQRVRRAVDECLLKLSTAESAASSRPQQSVAAR